LPGDELQIVAKGAKEDAAPAARLSSARSARNCLL
jgi:hypothetical protein